MFTQRSKLLLVMLLFCLFAQAEETAKLLPPPKPVKISVEIEWEKVEGAKLYELEFQTVAGEKLTTFRSNDNFFKFKMNVGRYKVRSRVADERKVFGAWSDLNEFTVLPKQPFLNENSVRTSGKINPKTLTSEVIYHWGTAPGALRFKLTIYDAAGNIVHEEITTKYSFKFNLPAGEYTATLTAIGPDEIQAEPIPLPGKVAIQAGKLRPPEILFETGQRLPLKNETPLVRWVPNSRRTVSGTLEYHYFFGEGWHPVQTFANSYLKEMLLEKAQTPGRYRLSLWAEAPGLLKSEPTVYEFVIKPKVY